VKNLLASYRWRRRLARLTGVALAVAAVVAVVLLWPNTAPEEQQAPSNVKARIEKEPRPVRLKAPDKKDALDVVSRFLYTAVARRHVDRSYNLVAPELRAGFTRRQWATQDIPVVPFPVRSARWRLEYSDERGVGFSVALFPTQESHQRAQVFLVGLHTIGKAKRQHWVIDNWQAAPSQGLQPVSGGPGGGGGGVLEQTSPDVNRFAKSTESAAWLLLPLGLLSLIIIIPLLIASVNWYRGHRAERALLRS
jgi:hypothetical protein